MSSSARSTCAVVVGASCRIRTGGLPHYRRWPPHPTRGRLFWAALAEVARLYARERGGESISVRIRETRRVQDISIVSSRLPTVYRPEGGQTVYLSFEGLRESRTIADKRTRIRVSMPVATALSFCQLLGKVVNDRGE